MSAFVAVVLFSWHEEIHREEILSLRSWGSHSSRLAFKCFPAF